MKRLLFISTVNLSLNPRILKEIRLAVSLSCDVTFIGFNMGDWSDDTEMEIKKSLRDVKFHYLEAGRRNFWRWLGDSLMERGAKLVSIFLPRSIWIAACSHNKRTIALLRWGRKMRIRQYDLVVGHTLGALYPAAVIAGLNDCPFVFDLEDYHPGEHIDEDPEREVARRELLLRTLLPKAVYVSAASTGIAQRVAALFGKTFLKVHPVLNYFSRDEFIPPCKREGKIRIIWFSQNISEGRGLELLVEAWKGLKEHCALTLIGQPSPSFVDSYLKGMEGEIEILRPLSQTELHKKLAQFDLGLALDLSSRDLNRDIALTNKILAYFQAGLYIVATDTSAQVDFLNRHPAHGRLIRQDSASIRKAIDGIGSDIASIRSAAGKRFTDAKEFCWETEARQLEILYKNND